MDKQWKTVIEPKTGLFDFNLREVWRYRDLCLMFIKKNYATRYKQTVLGPLYMILSPLLTSGIFSLIFGNIVGIATDGTPKFLFYMVGNMIWNFFAGCFGDNLDTFGNNAYIMGKVYFPRLVIPLSNILTKMIGMVSQLCVFFLFVLFYRLQGEHIQPGIKIMLVPFLILQIALLGLGIALLVSAMTVKYKDLSVMVGFAMRVWMYLSPVIYPISSLTGSLRILALCNPLAPILETARWALLGKGTLDLRFILLSVLVTIGFLLAGLISFHQVEGNFIDTI